MKKLDLTINHLKCSDFLSHFMPVNPTGLRLISKPQYSNRYMERHMYIKAKAMKLPKHTLWMSNCSWDETMLRPSREMTSNTPITKCTCLYKVTRFMLYFYFISIIHFSVFIRQFLVHIHCIYQIVWNINLVTPIRKVVSMTPNRCRFVSTSLCRKEWKYI